MNEKKYRTVNLLSRAAIEDCLRDVINERLTEIDFYRDVPLTHEEAMERARGWFREALFPSTPRVKDKPASGGKGAK